MAELIVFNNRQQAAAARDAGSGFRVGGFSAVLYVAHQCDSAQISSAFGNHQLKPITGSTTYEGKLRSGSPLIYSKAIDIPSDFTDGIQSFTVRLEHAVSQNVLWLRDGGLIVCAIPMRFQTAGLRTESNKDLEFQPNFRAQAPFDLTAMTRVLATISSPTFLHGAATSSADSLRSVGITSNSPKPMEGMLGVDIWSLTGTAGRPAHAPFAGSTECATYSWPLTALLNYSSDHVLNGFFHQMSFEEVYSQVRKGHCFMHDHGIFANSSCCLEITHFDDWTPQRSWDRLLQYGFDSSSLYLWGVAILRSETYRSISENFGEYLLSLTDRRMAAEIDQPQVQEECLRSLRLLDAAQGLHLALKEQRSQDIDTAFQRIFGDQVLETAARSRLDAVRDLLSERSNREEDGRRQAEVTRLTLAAAILAAAAIPLSVEQFWSWSLEHHYWRIATAAILMLLAVGLTTVVVRGHSPALPFRRAPRDTDGKRGR